MFETGCWNCYRGSKHDEEELNFNKYSNSYLNFWFEYALEVSHWLSFDVDRKFNNAEYKID